MKRVVVIIAIVIGALAALIVSAVMLVFSLTSDLPETADAFFTTAGAGDIDSAHTQLSTAFRENTSAEELERFLSDHALLEYQSAAWTSRSIHNDQGELVGTVTTKSGGKIPLTLQFIKEQGDWKIYSIESQAAGTRVADTTQTLPSPADRIALVRQTTHDFSVSLAEQSMEHLYSTLSTTWRGQTSVEELDEIFAGFYDAGITFDLDHMDPLFGEEAQIDPNGILTVAGHYPTEPGKVHFSYDYIREQGQWRLFGINVNIR